MYIDKFLKFKKIIINQITYDLKKNYSGSFLGAYWVLLIPLIFLAAYYIVFVKIFNVEKTNLDQGEFLMIIFIGIMQVISFIELLNSSENLLEKSSSVSFNFKIPINVFLLANIISASLKLVISLILCIIYKVIILDFNLYSFFSLFFTLFFYFIFCFGILKLTALLTFLFNDLILIIRFFSIGLIIISPISYTYETIPDKMNPFIFINPLSHFIFQYQDLFLNSTTFNIYKFGILFFLSFITLIFSNFIFKISLKKINFI